MRRIFKLSLVLINLTAVLILGIIIYYNKVLPNNYYVTSGSELKLSEIIETIPCSGTPDNEQAVSVGKTNIQRAELKLLGIIPIKTVNIQEVDEPVLIPCGNPFGIKLLTDGVIVVEVSNFETSNGFKAPAMEAGIKIGDIIKTIDGKNVKSNEDIAKIISESKGNILKFKIVRDEKSIV